jgi:5-formyltetrahydrofolate cyclo-ligase
MIVAGLALLISEGDVVLTFSGMADEPDLSALRAVGARFALTRTPDEGPLTVHPGESPVERHRWGFSQPVAGSPHLDLDLITVVLVPAVALGRDGSRLGHGKGYYDHLLPRLSRARRIGVAWECRLTPALPMDSHDSYLDDIATELGVRSAARRPI